MEVNRAPRFPHIPFMAFKEASTVNTAIDGTGTFDELVDNTALLKENLVIEKVRVKAQGVSVLSLFRLFIDDGVDEHLIHEEVVTAETPSGTAKSFEADIDLTDSIASFGLKLEKTWKLVCAVNDALTVNVWVYGSEY